MTPVVLDMYHGDVVTDLVAAKKAGILGIIHKASEKTKDPLYDVRRAAAKAAGLLWGAYHFNTGESAAVQVSRFFEAAKPDADTRMCLDFEGTAMSLATAIEFLRLADEKLGRRLTIYSGNRIKETIIHASQADRDFLALHPFWLCEYGPRARMIDALGHALPWRSWDLWQYAADGTPSFNSIPGIKTRGIDVNTYAGTAADLVDGWSGPPLASITPSVVISKPTLTPAPAPVPTPAAPPPAPTLWERVMRWLRGLFA